MADAPPLPEDAIEEKFLAATGPGGQNVNKVATAVQLRLNVYALRLLPAVFARLKVLAGSRWTAEGEIVITARTHRSQMLGHELAVEQAEACMSQQCHQPCQRPCHARPNLELPAHRTPVVGYQRPTLSPPYGQKLRAHIVDSRPTRP